MDVVLRDIFMSMRSMWIFCMNMTLKYAQLQLHDLHLHVVCAHACSHPTSIDDHHEVGAPHAFQPPLREQVLMPIHQGHLRQPDDQVTPVMKVTSR